MDSYGGGAERRDVDTSLDCDDVYRATQTLDQALRQRHAQRIFNLRLYPWRFHDLLLARYLDALKPDDRAPIIVTGDSTLAQNNLEPTDTVAGHLSRVLARRNRHDAGRAMLNIAVDGTAEAYLLVSIRAALALQPKIIYAGITIRDFTQVNDWLHDNPERVLDCMKPEGLFNDFTPSDQCLPEAELRRLRAHGFSIIKSSGPELLEQAGMDRLAEGVTNDGRAGATELPAPDALAATDGLRQFVKATGAPRRNGLYRSAAELALTIDDKNANKARILERNPFLQRLDYVMRAFRSERHRIVWVLMPLNGEIDIARFGLDRDIPTALEANILRLAKHYGYKTVSGGAAWPGDLFAVDDVVHLNKAGSARMAALIADHGAAEKPAKLRSRAFNAAELSAEYGRRVLSDVFTQAVQCAGPRFHIIALGENRPFLSAPIVADGSMHLSVSAPGLGDPLRLCLTTVAGETVLAIPLTAAGEINLRFAGGAVSIDAVGQSYHVQVSNPIVRIGYLDVDLADREAFVTIEDVCAEQPLWDMSVVLASDVLPLPFETGLDDDVGLAARAVPAQPVAIAARD